ncbi:MAG: BamA/TamA family outer membrane protein [Fibrobacteria bacterium]|nr:BamA/TamA family outer membrane protein [Fibrobacteria bacterium]
MLKNLSQILPILTTFVLLFGQVSSFGNSESDSTTKNDTLAFPEKLPAKDTWEHIISAPGYALNFPFWVTHKLIEKSIYFVDEKKIVPKIRRILVSQDGTRVIMPTFIERVGAGVRVRKTEYLGNKSTILTGGNYGSDHRHGLHLHLLEVPLYQKLHLNFTSDYENLVEERYYGTGSQTKSADISNYRNAQIISKAELCFGLLKKLTLNLSGSYNYHNVTEGKNEVDDDDGPPTNIKYPFQTIGKGFEPHINIASLSVGATLNRLKPEGHPIKGTAADVSYALFQEMGHGNYGFSKTTLDLKQYFHLFYDRTVMFRLNSNVIRPLRNENIPFFYLSEIGETGTVRGYKRGRFRDRDRLMGTIEYRYPIWSPSWRVIEMVVFSDIGQVAHNIFTDLEAENFFFGYGFGLRMYTELGRVLNFEVGFSDERIRVYFALN